MRPPLLDAIDGNIIESVPPSPAGRLFAASSRSPSLSSPGLHISSSDLSEVLWRGMLRRPSTRDFFFGAAWFPAHILSTSGDYAKVRAVPSPQLPHLLPPSPSLQR